METAYRTVAWALHRLPLATGTLAASLAGRRAAPERWRAWAGRHRGDGHLVWLHAASVGEALAAEPLVRRLRAALPGLQVALTHTSPSLAGRGSLAGADHVDYLPLDEPQPIARTLEALRPDLLLFSRGDVWPELARQAHARGVPLAVMGGMVRPLSGRLRWPARAVLQPVCRLLDYVGDQLIERPVHLERLEPLRSWARACVIVAGSVERADERALFAAAAALASDPTVRWLVVPHDPSVALTRRLLSTARSRGLAAAPWPGEGAPPGDAVLLVITTRGLLADLYAVGSIAYVGGGFRRGGLHAVAEPAARGLPVLFGPRWQEQRDAATLVACGGGAWSDGAAGLLAHIRDWRARPDRRSAAGLRARDMLDRGGAARTVQGLLRLPQWASQGSDAGAE
jgi:3-deoxy-D-manno-octulosonic-acid transferase